MRWLIRRRRPNRRTFTVLTYATFYEANTAYDLFDAGPGNTKQLLRVRASGKPALIREDTSPDNQLVMEATP